jgi:hypothetical protein
VNSSEGDSEERVQFNYCQITVTKIYQYKADIHVYTVELGYNVMKGTENLGRYNREYNIIVNSEELTGTTGKLTQ